MVGVVIASILTGLATAGFINLSTKDQADGSTTIFNEKGEPIVNVPSVTLAQNIPYLSIKATFERLSSSAVSKPNSPNLRIISGIPNNRLISVSLIPDSTFQTEGEAIIAVNGSDILTIKKASLTDVDVISIPIPDEALAIIQNTPIDINLWNTDGNTVSLSALVVTGVKQSIGV